MRTEKKKADERRIKSSIEINIKKEDPRMYGAQQRKRISVGRENTIVIGMTIALLLLLTISILGVLDLSYHAFSWAWLIENVKVRVNDIFNLITGSSLSSGINFFLTEFAAVVLASAALAASGAVYQGTFHNPMASPTLLGVQSGGMLGKVVFSLLMITPTAYSVTTYEDRKLIYDSQSILERYTGQLFVFAGCIVAVVIVVSVAKIAGRGKISTVAMILAGTVFSSVINTITTGLQYTFSNFQSGSVAAAAVNSASTTSFGSTSNPQILMLMAIPIIICLVAVNMMGGKLNVIVFGEDEARSLGMNVSLQRIILIGISTLLTATVIAFCGQIAFVGLIVPNLARRIVGPDFRYLLPASTMLGGILMLIAYDLTYIIGFTVNVGQVTSIAGGFVFLIIMTAYRRKRHGDWA